jgi:hypothetical protein
MTKLRATRVGATLCGCGLGLLLTLSCGDADKSSVLSGTGGTGDAAASDSDFPEIVIPDVARERIGDNVFDESRVQSYYLTVSDKEYAKLMDFSTLLANPWEVNDDRYVEASVSLGDVELPSIAVRFKGNYSIWGCIDFATKKRIERIEPFYGNIDVCQRFSLKLDFDRYVDRFRLDGLKKLNLHAMAADPSKLRERLGYSLFREMDIPAPRAVHARVYMNGEYQGLFAAVEEIDGRFTANRFPSAGDGNLFRDLWPSTTDASVSTAKSALRTNQDPAVADVSDFLAFRNAVASATEADFAAKVAPFVDLDYLARYIVVDRGINNFDGIMSFNFGPGWGPYCGNHFWYDVGGGQFALIPWDFDKTFWYPEPNFWSDNAPNGKNVVPNWNVITSSCNGHTVDFDAVTVNNGVRTEGTFSIREIDCDPFLKLLRGAVYDRQKAIANAFIAGPFSEQSVATKLDTWRAQIAQAVGEDPMVDSTNWQGAVDDLQAKLPKFQSNLSLMMSGLITD